MASLAHMLQRVEWQQVEQHQAAIMATHNSSWDAAQQLVIKNPGKTFIPQTGRGQTCTDTKCARQQ